MSYRKSLSCEPKSSQPARLICGFLRRLLVPGTSVLAIAKKKVRFCLEQYLNDLFVSLFGCKTQCSESLSGPYIDIRAAGEKRLHNLRVPFEGSAHQSSLVVLVSGINVGSPVQEQLDDFYMARC